MKVNFWIIQLIGAISWVVLLISYYRKDTNRILSFHIVSTVLDSLHYFLLGAYTGTFVCLFESIRDYGYYKSDKDKYIFLASIPVYIIMAIFTCNTFVDILPVLSSVIDGYTLTKHKKIVVFGAVVAYSCWVIYAFAVKSYVGVIVDGILVLSNLSILFFDKDLLKEKFIKNVK